MSEVEEKKKEKRDVLEEMLKEEKERRDTLSDVLQSIIPLMIIPQILPLFQQSLGQTLRETTVNVKVESSAAIIPIDIAAQTAIVAVDIKAQSVTLNVNIAAAEAVVKINVSAQSVDVQLTGTFYTLTGYEKKWDVGDFFTPNGGKYYPEGLINYTVPTGKRLVVYGIGISMFGMILFGSDHFSTRYPTAGWYYKYYTVGDDLFIEVNKNITQVYGLVVNYSQRCVYVELPTPLIFNAGEKLKLVGYTCSYMTYARVTVHAVEIPA